jgi:DNA-binding transcriptional LysR family regulator
MNQSEEMATLLRIVEQGGFAAAARGGPLTASALSKLVTRLEARLGVRLLSRTTRRLAPTPEGEIYLARARDILARIEAAEAEVTAGLDRPRGHIRLNTSSAFAKHRLLPRLPAFLARYPEITLEIGINDRRVDLVAEGADVLLRTGVLDDSSLVARKIADGRRVICASPAYLARAGMPRSPAALLEHECIVLQGLSRFPAWPFRTDTGVESLQVRGRLACDGADALLDMALAGLGIIRVTDFLAAQAIADGRLVPVLEELHASEPVPLWALTLPGRQRVPRIRALLDALAADVTT